MVASTSSTTKTYTETSVLEHSKEFYQELNERPLQLRKEFDELREFNSDEIKLLTEQNEQLKLAFESNNSENEEKAKFEQEINELKLEFEMKEKELQINYEQRENELKNEFELRENGLKLDFENQKRELSNEVDMSENATAIAMEESTESSEKNKELTLKLEEANATIMDLKMKIEQLTAKEEQMEKMKEKEDLSNMENKQELEIQLENEKKISKKFEIKFNEIESQYQLLTSEMLNLKNENLKISEDFKLKCEELDMINKKEEECKDVVSHIVEVKEDRSVEMDALKNEILKLELNKRETDSTIESLQKHILDKFHQLEGGDSQGKEERALMLKFLTTKF